MFATIGLLVLTGLLTLIYFWIKHQFSYWKNKNIPHVEPFSIFGNVVAGIFTFQKSPGEIFADLYHHDRMKNEPVVGVYIFNRPALVIREPALAKTIFIKEFNRFANRYATADPHGDALAYNNLFFIKAPQWKEMRTKVTPVFTTGKLKQMFGMIDEVGNQLNDYLCRLTETKKCSESEVKEISALYTTDVIASTAYGLRANCLKDPNSEFRRNGKTVFSWSTRKAIEFAITFFLPQFVKLLRIRVFSKEAAKFLRDSMNFAMTERIRTGIKRNDLIDILVECKKTAEAEGGDVDTDKFVAQAAIFFTAGFEPSSSTIAFGLHELSQNLELQRRLREEIKDSLIKNNGKITYESVNEMEYLHMVVQEILRMYPPQPFVDRECTLEKNEKEFSLSPQVDLSVPNGMAVYYSIYGIHRDPKYFPNPEQFDPERFSVENKLKIESFTYMPFGVGPHACIGERLGMLQSKMGLVNFLRSHSVEPCDKSHTKMQLEPRALLLSAKGGIYVNLIRDPLYQEA